MVSVQDTVPVTQEVRCFAADTGQDSLWVQVVLNQDVGNRRREDAIDSPTMVIYAIQLLQSVAERRVTHIVQQRCCTQKVIFRAKVRYQRKDTQSMLQTAVCMLCAKIGTATMVHKVEPTQR